MKPGSTARLKPLPSPALYSVPEPQPSAICIAAPNTNAPITRLTDSGAIAPLNSSCAAISGIDTSIARPIASSCAKNPVGSRSRIQTRQPVVKPNDTPASTAPKPMPTRNRNPCRRPTSHVIASHATTAPITSGDPAARAVCDVTWSRIEEVPSPETAAITRV